MPRRLHRLLTAASCSAFLLGSCQGEVTSEPPPLSALPPLPEPVDGGAGPAGEERPVRELQIALVGEVRGEIEPCGCPTLPYGGFIRRQRLLETLRAEGPVVHLDAGELLLKGLSTSRSENREARAALVLELSREVGVDAWVPGPTDLLALGVDGLRGLEGRAAPPALSATWRDAEGQPVLPGARVVERDGVRIGVVGLSASPSSSKQRANLTQVDPAEAARAALATLPSDLDLVVGLGNLADAEADRVAEALPELSLMLTTRGEELDAPRRVGEVTIIETPDRGRYLQLVRLRLGSTPDQPVEFVDEEQRWRDLATLRTQATTTGTPSEALAEMEAWFAERGAGRNLGYHRAVPLASNLDGEAAVADEVEAFKEATLARASEVAARPPAPTEPGYATAGRCVSCHREEFMRWTATDHARAWESLLVREATGDPECIGCHSTGFGEPGGFGELSPSKLRAFKGVQCESCHGPMRGHPEDPAVISRPVTEASCTGCHDPANSPGFEWETYLRRSVCQDLSVPAAEPGVVPGAGG